MEYGWVGIGYLLKRNEDGSFSAQICREEAKPEPEILDKEPKHGD